MEQVDLSYFFKTKAQANDFTSRLAAISAKIYETNFNLEKLLIEHFGMQKTEKFLILLRENKVQLQANTSLKEFLTKLQETVSQFPVLTLTVAFEPTEQTLQSLSEWFIINFKKQILFEISVDPQLIAGAAITYKGNYLDFSIKSAFAKILSETISPSTQPASAQNQPATPLPPANNVTQGNAMGTQTTHQSIEHLSIGR